ncbi:hypothetical protein MAR_014978 [Mya arenaria]|uniref:Uncharacterized protein n=1 Tax=Mya arenaria TaxID=6604 RepID=A0ABY7FJF5_MYAAR|nr:hypothetical protein MAR_014978 [Mya arenaria]
MFEARDVAGSQEVAGNITTGIYLGPGDETAGTLSSMLGLGEGSLGGGGGVGVASLLPDLMSVRMSRPKSLVTRVHIGVLS